MQTSLRLAAAISLLFATHCTKPALAVGKINKFAVGDEVALEAGAAADGKLALLQVGFDGSTAPLKDEFVAAMTTKELRNHMLAAAEKQSRYHPFQPCTKHLKRYLRSDEGAELDDADLQNFYRIVRGALTNPDSKIGCTAMRPGDYDKYKWFFERVVRDLHHDRTLDVAHRTNWDIEQLGDRGVLDVRKAGYKGTVMVGLSIRRSLVGFNMPVSMSKTERVRMERTLLPAFRYLQDDAGYGGKVYSLTPDFGGETNPNLVSELPKDDSLVPDHHSPSSQTYGQGRYITNDGLHAISYGGKEHLRLVITRKTFDVAEAFVEAKFILNTLEKQEDVQFVHSKTFGYITSRPDSLGTGLQATAFLKLPHLANLHDSELQAPHSRLIVRHSHSTEDTIEVSNRYSCFVTEEEILVNLYSGIKKLVSAEAKAAKARSAAGHH